MKRTALAAALLILLGGCGAAPATRFYTLAAVSPAQPPALPQPSTATKQPTLWIDEPSIPPYLDRPQIVIRSGVHRLQLAEYAHWGSDLRAELRRVLADNLARRLPGHAVLPASTFSPPSAAIRLVVEIVQFEASADGQLQLAARWRERPDGVLRELRVSRSFIGTADATLVAAMSDLYGELADAIAASLGAGVP